MASMMSQGKCPGAGATPLDLRDRTINVRKDLPPNLSLSFRRNILFFSSFFFLFSILSQAPSLVFSTHPEGSPYGTLITDVKPSYGRNDVVEAVFQVSFLLIFTLSLSLSLSMCEVLCVCVCVFMRVVSPSF